MSGYIHKIQIFDLIKIACYIDIYSNNSSAKVSQKLYGNQFFNILLIDEKHYTEGFQEYFKAVNSLVQSFLRSGLDPFRGISFIKVKNNPKELYFYFDLLMKCIYEGYKLNLLKHSVGSQYISRKGLVCNAYDLPKLFKENNKKEFPPYLLTDKIMIRDEISKPNFLCPIYEIFFDTDIFNKPFNNITYNITGKIDNSHLQLQKYQDLVKSQNDITSSN